MLLIMSKYRQKVISVILALFFVISGCNQPDMNSNSVVWENTLPQQEAVNQEEIETGFGSQGYVRSATYFSDEWPMNFWNSDMDDLDQELLQIKRDGFDSIILIIPWREFQPEIEPVVFNEKAFDSLKEVMEAARNCGLDVYVRIGYTWDYHNDAEGSIIERFWNLLSDETTNKAWYEYVKKLYDELSRYNNFKAGFITWEDFWNILGMCDGNILSRRSGAKKIGYIAWTAQNYTLEAYNERYGTGFRRYEDIVIPKRDEPAMFSMYEFYDDFMNSLLKQSQKVFPNLSMEVRLDWDSVADREGETEYYKHNSTFSCVDAGFTATMYGIPMGFENIGEKVSYEEAMEKTEYILRQLKAGNGDKPVYIEQFIFADNTPKFSYNAQIEEDQIDDYLENISSILLENSEGYGIWTYRNYCTNMIYNSQFALEMEGWGKRGKVDVENWKDTNVCVMKRGSGINQKVARSRDHFGGDVYKFEIEVKQIREPGKILVKMGGVKKEIDITEAGIYSLDMEPWVKLNFNIDITTECDIVIDNIKLYSQIQEGYLYDVNNNELDCMRSLRVLNAQLGDNVGDR